SHTVQRVLAGRHWRELTVATEAVPGTVLEGVIDLLGSTDEGLELVDYKTDTVSSGSVEAVARRYRLQVGAYALALARSADLHGAIAEVQAAMADASV